MSAYTNLVRALEGMLRIEGSVNDISWSRCWPVLNANTTIIGHLYSILIMYDYRFFNNPIYGRFRKLSRYSFRNRYKEYIKALHPVCFSIL